MANHLSMALIDTIRTLRLRRWSLRKIARELNLDRATVARYLRDPVHAPAASGSPDVPVLPAQPNAANAPLGSSTETLPSNTANAPLGCLAQAEPADNDPAVPGPGRASDCEPWRALILSQLELGLSAQRIFQDLKAEHGCTVSYHSVRRFVHRLQQHTPLPFRRLECQPGQETQVDFGTGAPILIDGHRRRTHVLRIVLSHSRKGYAEVVYRQSTDELIRILENGFWAFGGVPQTVVIDNLKAAVTQPDWFDPELNPKRRSFANHYGFALLPTRPYTPRHKGKVERGVDYVQENALKGRQFDSLEAQNTFLHDWEQTVADTRVHGTIRQQVGTLFTQVERPALLPLPAERFPFFHEARRRVHRDGHVEVEKAYYSTPPEYVGRGVWVRWDGRLVRLLNDRLEPIGLHVRQEPGRFSTLPEHIASEKIAGVERGAVWLLERIRRLGSQAAGWAEAVIANRGVEGMRVLVGLLSLAGRHPATSIDRACGVALACGAYRLKTVRALIDRDAPKQEPLPFVEEHPMIRPLTDYEQLVHTSFHKESGT
jgi:transposase